MRILRFLSLSRKRSFLGYSDFVSEGVEPEVGDCSGSYEIQDGMLLWELPAINDENKEAAFHFQCHSEDQGNCFFPVSVSFSTRKLLSGLQVFLFSLCK